MLNTVNDVPDKVLSILSLAKITKDDAPCSKDIQKKTTKKAKTTTAIILSLTTLVYLVKRVITTNKKRIKAINMITS
ncbi:hypothetical protein D3C85_1718990 [compost metagenome]